MQSQSLLGVDARTIFSPASRTSLDKAAASPHLSVFNPLCVHSMGRNQPFYAILHRIDIGIVIDLEPDTWGDPISLLVGAVQSEKLAVQAISRLQALPRGDIGTLCDTLNEEIKKLTGYDRVMVYKFHDDEHGEIVSEVTRPDLEPYLGLHYPAIDIPQAARFLFKKNRVRMIYDCNAHPVNIIQSKQLKQPLCMVNSTLRSPYGCHTQYMGNMGSVASLVMAIVVKGHESRLWGMVVCHHTSPRYVPFPNRRACEFLMDSFAVQLQMELQLASQMVEKKILQIQTMLCNMLMQDSPFSIITRSPNIMDLVKCDGAAMFYGGECHLLGVTPSEAQVKDIVKWLLHVHGDSTGLSTDSLVDAGYSGATLLGDAVCGMVAAGIDSTDFLFWFRSHAAKEIKWGRAKHHAEDRDDDRKMHPRSSFKTFLELVKNRSFPWEIFEINAIHSLQLIVRDSFRRILVQSLRPSLDELSSLANEMVRLIDTAIAPIFGVCKYGFINGWNAKMAELTGLQANEALGKSLVNEIIHKDSRIAFEKVLHKALQGEEDKNVEVKLQNFQIYSAYPAIHLIVNACISRNHRNKIVGVCFAGQYVTPEKVFRDMFIRMQEDYKAILQSPNSLIPPIFASDENACCSEWNAAMEKLTGWMKHEVVGNILPGLVFGIMCQFKDQDVLLKFRILLQNAIRGHDTGNLQFVFSNRNGKFVEVFLTANKRVNEHGAVVGCFCFLQTIPVDQPSSSLSQQERGECILKFQEVEYIRWMMKPPLNGIRLIHTLLKKKAISDDRRLLLLNTGDACERQITSVVEDKSFGGIIEGFTMELECEEFILGNVIDAIVFQITGLLKEKDLQLIYEISEQMKTLSTYGDRYKLQLVLSNILTSIVNHTPCDGWIEIKIIPKMKSVQGQREYLQLQFSLAHQGEGIPVAFIQQMFEERNQCSSQQGLALNVCYKLVRIMNGSIHYGRYDSNCNFYIDFEFRIQNSMPLD